MLRIGLAPLTAIFYWLGGFIPRKKKRWIFGSYGNAFNDNSKYLYIHVVENHPEIDAIWITGNPKVRDHVRSAGGKAFSRWSVRGLWACLTGQYWFVSAYVADINYYCSRNAILVNLWHGIPLKKIEFDIESGPLAARFQQSNLIEQKINWTSNFRRPEYVLSTSERVSRKSFATAFRITPDQCLNLGYPRTDSFYKSADERLRTIERWDPPATRSLIDKISRFSSCMIYMPTWRDANPNFMEKSGWDFPALNEALKKKNILFLLKLHINTPSGALHQLSNLSHIHLMQPSEDAYSVLPFTTGLITDYSSILFDYLLLDKPIYYYPFDRKEYESDSRGFYYKYDTCTAGHEIKSPKELTDIELNSDAINFSSARCTLREEFFEHADGKSAERIVRKFADDEIRL